MLRSTIVITALWYFVHASNCPPRELNDAVPYVPPSGDPPAQPYPPPHSPATTTPKPQPTCHQQSLSQISNNVTCRFLKEIIKNYPHGGFTVSVFNILHVLLMIANAAGGETRYQLTNKYLGICDLNKINGEFQAYLTHLKDNRTSSGKQKTLVIPAAGVFVEKKFPVRADYKQNMQKYYGAPASNEPFSTDPPKALNDINEYIRKLTQDYYKKFFTTPFDTSTVVVEVSTFYLLSSWLGSDYFNFNKNKQEFTSSCKNNKPSKSVYAQYLSNDRGLNPAGYAVINDGGVKWETVRVPLYSEKYSVILIHSQNRCQEAVPYLKNLTPAKIKQLFKALANYRSDCQVWFDLPQFKINSTYHNVIQILQAGGVIDLFEDANLSNGIRQSQVPTKIKVSTIVHKCDVSMNKTGILAVAATAAGATTTAVRTCEKEPKRVKFDHPFNFLIVENTAEAIIFSGSVNAPNYPLVA